MSLRVTLAEDGTLKVKDLDAVKNQKELDLLTRSDSAAIDFQMNWPAFWDSLDRAIQACETKRPAAELLDELKQSRM